MFAAGHQWEGVPRNFRVLKEKFLRVIIAVFPFGTKKMRILILISNVCRSTYYATEVIYDRQLTKPVATHSVGSRRMARDF